MEGNNNSRKQYKYMTKGPKVPVKLSKQEPKAWFEILDEIEVRETSEAETSDLSGDQSNLLDLLSGIIETETALNCVVQTLTDPTSNVIDLPSSLERSMSPNELNDIKNFITWSSGPWTTMRKRFMKYPIWFSKNRFHVEMPDEGRLRHAIACIEAAIILSSRYTILDVDNINNFYMPSASDITLLTPEGDMVFLDLTYGTAKQTKLSNLISSVRSCNFGVSRQVECWVIKVTKDFPIPTLTEPQVKVAHNWKDEPEEATIALRECLKGASSEELSQLIRVLEDSISPGIMCLLPDKARNDNSIDRLKMFVPEVLEAISNVQGIDVEDVPEYLLKSVNGSGEDPVTVYEELKTNLPKEVRESEFFTCGEKGVLARKNPRCLKTPAPISLTVNPILSYKRLHEIDLMLWVFVISREKNEVWKAGDPTEYTLMADGGILSTPFPPFVRSAMDVDQSLSLKFPGNLAAYLKLITFETIDETGNKILKTTSHFQVLLNPDLVGCKGFKKFLSRKDKTLNDGNKEEWVPSNEAYKRSAGIVQKIIEDMIPGPAELVRQCINKRSLRNKNKKIFQRKASASVQDAYSTYAFREGTLLLNAAEATSSTSRSLTPFLNIKHPSNCYVLLEAAGYGQLDIWSLPGSFPNFSTTWRRSYVITESEHLEAYDISRLMGYRHGGPFPSNEAVLALKVSSKIVKAAAESHPDLMVAIFRNSPETAEYENDIETFPSLVASKFHSVDKMHLEWEIELPYRLLNRLASLTENRGKLYSQLMNSGDIGDLKEINLNLLSFFPNRQQFSVVSTAWRYLHQALGSIDCEPSSTLKKLSGVSLKDHIEINYIARMVSIYKLSMLCRVMKNINFLRATNKEVFVSAPDLLYATNSASLNVSTYSTSNLLNVNKQWRISSEAACVQAAWEQADELELLMRTEPELWYGMPLRVYSELTSLNQRTIGNLIMLIERNSSSITSYTRKMSLNTNPKQFASNFWFEVLVHLQLRAEKGIFLMKENLAGKGLREFLTMRGSTIATELKDYDSNPAVRKATAFLVFLSRLFRDTKEVTDPYSLTELEREVEDLREDQLGLARKILESEYIQLVEPICQFSEKDAPGKDREISTLNIEFGMTCLLCEKICQNYSAGIPEDLVTHSAKEMSIYKSVLEMERRRDVDAGSEVLYINQDKSKYGPNRKVNSMLLTAAILSGDDETFALFNLALQMSSKKKIAYPHEIVKQSLKLGKPVSKIVEKNLQKVRCAEYNELPRPALSGQTSVVMNKIIEQYDVGNQYGPRNSVWVEVREGMPGQGIFTTLSSISHAAAQRFYSKWISHHKGWFWSSRVTSDDSMTMIIHPADQSTLVHNGIKTLISGLTYQMGLIENKAKMTITARRPEMNTFYMLKGEPVCAVWKFSSAYSSLQASGNLGEDLLVCVSKGSDLYRVGASYFSSSFLTSVLMCMVLDAYRFWGPYLDDNTDESKNEAKELLWSSPVELFGLPTIDPIAPIITPIGTRVVSAMDTSISRAELGNYVRLVLDSILSASKLEQDSMSKDSFGNVTYGSTTVLSLKEGEVLMPVRKLPPTVNGLIGSLYRRRNEIKVAKELGRTAVSNPVITSHKGWGIRRLLEAVRASFEEPMKRGHSQRGVLQIYQEIAHSPNYKYLKVSSNSFFPVKYKGDRISINQLKALLSDVGFLRELSTNFREQLDTISEIEPMLEELRTNLLRSSYDCLQISDLVKGAKLVPNMCRGDYSESAKEGALGRRVLKRLVRLNFANQHSTYLNFNAIRAGLLSRYIRNRPTYMREYIGLAIEPRGDLDEFEAWEEADIALERIKTLVPKPTILYSESLSGAHDRRNDLNDWIKYNAYVDHNFNLSEVMLQEVNPAAKSGAPAATPDKPKSQIFQTYNHGPLDISGCFRYEIDPVTSRYVFSKEGNNAAVRWLMNMAPDDLYNLAEVGQICTTSATLMNEMAGQIVSGIWYGSPLERVKIHSTNRISSDEGLFHVFEVSRIKAESKRYYHYLITFNSIKYAQFKEGSEISQFIEDWQKGKNWESASGRLRSEIGDDIYEVINLSSEDTFVVRVNFMDYEAYWPNLDVSIPLGKMVPLHYWNSEDEQIKLSLRSAKRLKNKGPGMTSTMKIPLTRMTEADQKEWLSLFEALIRDVGKEDFPQENRSTLLELAGSFLISGNLKLVRTGSLRRGSDSNLLRAKDENELNKRAMAFTAFSELVGSEFLPLPYGFYKAWQLGSKSYKKVRAFISVNTSLDAVVGGDDGTSFRFYPEEWEQGTSNLANNDERQERMRESLSKLVATIKTKPGQEEGSGPRAVADQAELSEEEARKKAEIEEILAFDIFGTGGDLEAFIAKFDTGPVTIE